MTKESRIYTEERTVSSIYSVGYLQLLRHGSNLICPLTEEWIKEKVLLYSTQGNLAQCYVAAWVDGKFWGEWINVYTWPNPFAVYLKLQQLC